MASVLDPEYLFYPELASTNAEMKRLIQLSFVDEGTVVMTDHQTAGKGQGRNTWESENGKNLNISLLLRPAFLEPYKQFYISKMISLAILDTLRGLTSGISIKWPNDIYIDNSKLAGILIENSIMGAHLDYCIVGIGLNVNQQIFRSDAPNPISLITATNTPLSLETIRDQLMLNIQKRYRALSMGDEARMDKEYFAQLYRCTGRHPFRDQHGRFMASIESVNEMGLLTLRDEQGRLREYAFKEVEFILP